MRGLWSSYPHSWKGSGLVTLARGGQCEASGLVTLSRGGQCEASGLVTLARGG